MNILEAIKQQRDDIKEWTKNNLVSLDNKIDEIPTEIFVGEGQMPQEATIQIITDGSDEEQAFKDELIDYINQELATGKYDGKNAYQYAQEGGYTGTETEFAQRMAFLMINSVYGYIDENGDVVLKGNITDGAILKLEMEDGTTIDIAEASFYHSVTNNLTNCINNNSATEIVKGKAYNATISANSGYKLKSVTVTMGGAPVTATNGVIAIEKVTGDIVITAVAEVAQLVTKNITLTEKTSIVTGDGSTRENTTGHCATDFIDVSNIPKPCTIKLEGAGWVYVEAGSTGYIRFYVENVNGTKLVGDYTHPSKMPNGVTMTCSGSTSSNGHTYIDATITVTSDNIGKLRFAGMYTQVTPNAFDPSVTKATLTYTPST